jgi:hypothetical protein
MKISLKGLIRRSEQAEERISKLEERSLIFSSLRKKKDK